MAIPRDVYVRLEQAPPPLGGGPSLSPAAGPVAAVAGPVSAVAEQAFFRFRSSLEDALVRFDPKYDIKSIVEQIRAAEGKDFVRIDFRRGVGVTRNGEVHQLTDVSLEQIQRLQRLVAQIFQDAGLKLRQSEADPLSSIRIDRCRSTKLSALLSHPAVQEKLKEMPQGIFQKQFDRLFEIYQYVHERIEKLKAERKEKEEDRKGALITRNRKLAEELSAELIDLKNKLHEYESIDWFALTFARIFKMDFEGYTEADIQEELAPFIELVEEIIQSKSGRTLQHPFGGAASPDDEREYARRVVSLVDPRRASHALRLPFEPFAKLVEDLWRDTPVGLTLSPAIAAERERVRAQFSSLFASPAGSPPLGTPAPAPRPPASGALGGLGAVLRDDGSSPTSSPVSGTGDMRPLPPLDHGSSAADLFGRSPDEIMAAPLFSEGVRAAAYRPPFYEDDAFYAGLDSSDPATSRA